MLIHTLTPFLHVAIVPARGLARSHYSLGEFNLCSRLTRKQHITTSTTHLKATSATMSSASCAG